VRAGVDARLFRQVVRPSSLGRGSCHAPPVREPESWLAPALVVSSAAQVDDRPAGLAKRRGGDEDVLLVDGDASRSRERPKTRRYKSGREIGLRVPRQALLKKRLVGGGYGTTVKGRIMSLSSCSTMWQ
jgi:hypothetical protein